MHSLTSHFKSSLNLLGSSVSFMMNADSSMLPVYIRGVAYPSRPRRAAELFSAEATSRIREQNPNRMSKADLRAECRRQWELLPFTEKRKYLSAERTRRDRYETELAKQGIPHSPTVTGFTRFAKDQLNEMKVNGTYQSGIVLTHPMFLEKWRALPEETRQEYQTAAKQDCDRYREELKRVSWPVRRVLNDRTTIRNAARWEGPVRVTSSSSQEPSNDHETSALEMMEPKPKAPLTPFFLFQQQQQTVRRRRLGGNGLLDSRSVGSQWQQMSDEQKHPYVRRYNLSMTRYWSQLAEWHQRRINLSRYY